MWLKKLDFAYHPIFNFHEISNFSFKLIKDKSFLKLTPLNVEP